MAKDACDLGRRVRRIIEHGLVASDFAKHCELGVDAARLMMQEKAACAFRGAGRAGNHHNRRAFRISAGDRVDQIERAGAVRHDGDAQAAVIADRRIGREADGRLMTQFEMRKDPRFLDHFVEGQHEIAGDSENLARAVIFKCMQQCGGQRRHGLFPWRER